MVENAVFVCHFAKFSPTRTLTFLQRGHPALPWPYHCVSLWLLEGPKKMDFTMYSGSTFTKCNCGNSDGTLDRCTNNITEATWAAVIDQLESWRPYLVCIPVLVTDNFCFKVSCSGVSRPLFIRIILDM